MTSRKNHQLLSAGKNGEKPPAEHNGSAESTADSNKQQLRAQAAVAGMKLSSGGQFQLNLLLWLAVVAFLYFAKAVVVPLLLAAAGAMVLKPVINCLTGAGLPRALAALLVLGVFLGAIGFGFVELSQPAMKWISDAPKEMTQLRQRADKIFPSEKLQKALDAISQLPSSATAATNNAPSVQVTDHTGTGKAINWTAGVLAGIIETIVLLYMFLILGDAFLSQLLDGKDEQGKRAAMSVGREVQETISNYFFAISLINLCLGSAIGAGLYFLGVPNAVLWGLMAMLFNYVPYFGPIGGIALVGIVGILTIDAFPKSLLPAAWYLALHVAEADYITPVLLGRRFTISPIVIFVSLLFGVWLWGVIGALLAVPVLISFKVLCQRVPRFAAGNRFL